MSNPERKNALSGEACETMAEHLRELAYDRSVRCVVVAGEDNVFCSGSLLAKGRDSHRYFRSDSVRAGRRGYVCFLKIDE
jgi:enoyl-CoA hydratase/carnithine racemase